MNEIDLATNPDLVAPVTKNTKLKEMIVEYVGIRHNPENDEVTLDMVVETFSKEFPEFLLPIAEENFFRGYKQAMEDVTNSEMFYDGEENAAKEE
jgi:hypothetical protein